MQNRYALNLTPAARRDIGNIARWTNQNFGSRQAAFYRANLAKLALRIGTDPHCNSGFEVGTEPSNMRLLHMRFVYPKGRHLMLYRVRSNFVDIIRVLHDEMDISRHIKMAQSRLKT